MRETQSISAAPQQRGQCGAHAVEFFVGVHHLPKLVVGLPDRVRERTEKVGRRFVVVERRQRRDGDRTRDVARRVAPHTVGDGEQPGARVDGVLVVGADEADVGTRRVAQDETHRRNSSTVLPMRIGMR